MFTRTVNCFAVERGHNAADHGHGAPNLYYFAVDAYCCAFGYLALTISWGLGKTGLRIGNGRIEGDGKLTNRYRSQIADIQRPRHTTHETAIH